MCERQLDLLNVAFEARLREATRLRVPHDQFLEFWCDLSQSVARKPWGAKLRPFRPRAQFFLRGRTVCRWDGLDENVRLASLHARRHFRGRLAPPSIRWVFFAHGDFDPVLVVVKPSWVLARRV